MRRAGASLGVCIAVGTLLAGGASPAYARSAVGLAHLPSALIRVTDALTGFPVGGAEVVVTFIEGDPDNPIVIGHTYTDRTNSGGLVFFMGLPEGDYIASVDATGYVKFGDGANGDRPPRGAHIAVSYDRGGGGQGNQPVRLPVGLVPVDCRTCG
jgi:hypothetical protein